MSLSSIYLDAFLAVSKTRNFSTAAESLFITQSALSQRIKNLEQDLSLTLFVRTSAGAVLTEQGEKLLRYCQTRDLLEEELVSDMNAGKNVGLSGNLKIGSYSSVMRSVLLPSLAPLLKKHPGILCEFIVDQMENLPGRLQSAELDFVIMDYQLDKTGLQTQLLGHETYVVIESKKATERNHIYLDNNPLDRTTENFFKIQKNKVPKYKRSYCGDCYGIIDGVSQGLGRAVMSEHLIKGDSSLGIVGDFKSYKVDVVLHYFQQPFYSKLHMAVMEDLKKNTAKFL